jgi:hypothetical protein
MALLASPTMDITLYFMAWIKLGWWVRSCFCDELTSEGALPLGAAVAAEAVAIEIAKYSAPIENFRVMLISRGVGVDRDAMRDRNFAL